MRLMELFNLNREDFLTDPCDSRRAVVALGGGGARGVAHLGAMQMIGESGVHTEQIVGVSMGSLIGALCASDLDIKSVQTKAIELLRSPIFQHKQAALAAANTSAQKNPHKGETSWYSRLRTMLTAHRAFLRVVSTPSLLDGALLKEVIEWLVPDIDLRDLPTPLAVVTADLLSGRRVVLESGPLRKAVQASMSIPGIFPPVKWKDKLLCDIGVFDSIPIAVARSYATDLTIAVDVGQQNMAIDECKTALDVLIRMEDIGERLLRREVIKEAEILIRPQVGRYSWFDFSEPEALIQAGRDAAKKSLLPITNR